MTVQLPEGSLALLREGYTFISSRCDRFGTDAFRTRLMLRPVICLRGAEAAEFFYGGGRFGRKGHAPLCPAPAAGRRQRAVPRRARPPAPETAVS